MKGSHITSSANGGGRIRIETRLTELLEIDLPIICGPMFLVSDVELVVAACEAGILGSFPAMNYRRPKQLQAAIRAIKERTSREFAVNLIVNRSNVLFDGQLQLCQQEGVPVYITSMGNPAKVIEAAQESGARVICDVTTLEYARKVQALGADAVNAVVAGAGGHTGSISPFVLLPYLAEHLEIPVVCAGGVADGRGMAAAFALGADGVQLGTRFIAATECQVTDAYKDAVVGAAPEDIMFSDRISGQTAAVIKTPFMQRLAKTTPRLTRMLTKNRYTKRLTKAVLAARSFVLFGNAAHKPTWKTVWSAGQAVGLIDQVQSVGLIVEHIVASYLEAINQLPPPQRTTSALLH